MTDTDTLPLHYVVVAVDVTITITVAVHAPTGREAMQAVDNDIAANGWGSALWQHERWDSATVDWESARDLHADCLALET